MPELQNVFAAQHWNINNKKNAVQQHSAGFYSVKTLFLHDVWINYICNMINIRRRRSGEKKKKTKHVDIDTQSEWAATVAMAATRFQSNTVWTMCVKLLIWLML